MARPKYVLLLPLNYNDGSEVPKDVRDMFLEELFVLAGGYHIAGAGRGPTACGTARSRSTTRLRSGLPSRRRTFRP